MNIRYLDRLPDVHRDEAVRLILDLLPEKFEPVLGSGDTAHRVLRNGMDTSRCVAAIADGRLAGLLAIQKGKKSLVNPGLPSLINAYGLTGGLFRLAGLWLLYHSPDPGEFYVDGVVVAREFQGRGIGSGLFAALERRALEQGMEKICLEVIDTNPRAEALYRRLGFSKIKTDSMAPFNRIFGFPFSGSVLMEKRLPRAHAEG